jgi:hypothetical protein
VTRGSDKSGAPLVFNIIEFFYFEMPGLGLRERVDTDTPG